ncbi:MAG: hypothetical protein AABW50_00765 [Nanoarchaeota archaeon]
MKKRILKGGAISEILILIIAIIAFSYAIGSEVGEVRATTPYVGPAARNYPQTPVFESCYNGKGTCKENCSFGELVKKDEICSENHKCCVPDPFKQEAQIVEAERITNPQDPNLGTAAQKPSLQEATALAGSAASVLPIGSSKTNPSALNLGEEYSQSRGAPSPTPGASDAGTTSAGSDLLGIKGWFNNNLKPNLGNIIQNAGIASLIWTGIKILGPLVTSDKQGINAAANAISIGYLVGSSADSFASIFSKSAGNFLGKKLILGLSGANLLGIGIGVYIFLSSYKKETEQRYSFSCYPWQAPSGGENCEKCNEGILPCTEYQCKSLGQGCELENKGTQEELCVWKTRGDTIPPVITPWKEVLEDKFSYNPDSRISPPDRGVYIKYDFGCVPAFTPFTFGLQTNEPSVCKTDVIRKGTFDEMAFYFGESSTLKYNHTQTISLPSKESLEAENLTLKNDGNYELHVRCIDANGNSKTDSPSASFVFKYCVDPGPDTTAPRIISTSINSGEPIGFNTSSVDLELYLNEPSSCRWTHDRDKDFSQMESLMSCSSSAFSMNAQMLYKCSTTLTGLKSREENKFYFRCQDNPLLPENKRNVNNVGYLFTVIGTQPLVIDSFSPNGTIKDSTDIVKVTLKAETSAGYKEGDATCYYSESCYDNAKSKNKYVSFYYPNGESSYTHSQDIYVEQGTYECSLKCIDRGGNQDKKEFSYTVDVDGTQPEIVRAFKEESQGRQFLKIITSEESSCVYSTNDCSYLFDDGIRMIKVSGIEHYTEWNTNSNYYVKCKDKYGNQPNPNICSMVARPFEFFER